MLTTLTGNMAAGVRVQRLEGKEYLVAPMVMITEGVHNGSGGALYYPSEELSKTPQSWDHKPVVVYHPTINGRGVSACTPEVIENRKIGIILNTKYRPGRGKKTGRLTAEAWLDQTKVEAVDKRVLEAIESETIMELSTGLYTDNITTNGTFGGKAYGAIARNYRPDHLAILPDQVGACSIADGAGLLQANHANDIALFEALSGPVRTLVTNLKKFTLNGLSFGAISSLIYTALRDKYGTAWDGWVEEVYPKFVIYFMEQKFWKLEYTLENDLVTLGTLAVEVTKVMEYRNVETSRVVNWSSDSLAAAALARRTV